MDTMKQQLDELKETIKKAEEEKTKALTAGHVSFAEKVQDHINELEKQKTYLMQQLGESHPCIPIQAIHRYVSFHLF